VTQSQQLARDYKGDMMVMTMTTTTTSTTMGVKKSDTYSSGGLAGSLGCELLTRGLA
jgi:hypothetical protein